ncbi:EpsG family protein [Virgibacillus sp. 6R]|uniref:EpsG family protein n=1 Tax=Metabacillus sp. 22489 TaxID=3453928 RepID=UPI0011A623C8
MTLFWINLFLVYSFSFSSRLVAGYTNPISNNFPKPYKPFVALALLSLILISGLRINIGDTSAYTHSYLMNDFTWEYVQNNKDPGFSILQMILKNITEDPQLLLFITAFVTNLLIGITLYKYSRNIEISLYVYITSGLFTVSMNGIRQFLAASIIFFSLKYLLKGEFKFYLIFVLIASTFHQSALILIPIYFIVRRKAWTKFTLFIIALAVTLVFGFNYFSEILFSAIEDSQYSHYSDFNEGGANIMRVLVDIVPVIIAFLGREKLRILWPKIDIIVNLSLINLVFGLIATQNWIFARFNIYFSLFNLILITWIIYAFKDSNKKLIYYGIIVLYFLYYYYDHVIIQGINYQSNIIKF